MVEGWGVRCGVQKEQSWFNHRGAVDIYMVHGWIYFGRSLLATSIDVHC